MIKGALSCFFGLLFLVIEAQESAIVIHINSLEEAWSKALELNPDYHSYQLNVEKARLSYKQSKAYKYPSLTGTYSSQTNLDLATTPVPGELFGQPGETVNAQFGQKYNYNAGLSLSKNLLDFGAIMESRVSKLNIDMAEAQSVEFQQLLKEQVAIYYFMTLLATKSIEISGADLTVADSIVNMTTQKQKEGYVDQLSVNSSLINRSSVRRSVISYETTLAQSQMGLKQVLGMGVDDRVVLLEELNYLIPEMYTQESLMSRPVLLMTIISKQQAELKVKASKFAFLPKLSINPYFGQQQFSDESGISFGEGRWSDYSYLSLNLSIPIFSGFAKKNGLAQSKIERSIYENDYRRELKKADLGDQLLIKEYALGRSDAEAAQEIYHLNKKNHDLSLAKYNEGLISLDGYLKSFEEYLKSETTFLNSLSNTYNYYSQIIARIE